MLQLTTKGSNGGFGITIRMKRGGKLGTDITKDEADKNDFSRKQSLFKRTTCDQISDAQGSNPNNHHNFHHSVSKKEGHRDPCRDGVPKGKITLERNNPVGLFTLDSSGDQLLKSRSGSILDMHRTYLYGKRERRPNEPAPVKEQPNKNFGEFDAAASKKSNTEVSEI